VRNPPLRGRRWAYVVVPLSLLLVAAAASPYVFAYFGVPLRLPFNLPGLPASPTERSIIHREMAPDNVGTDEQAQAPEKHPDKAVPDKAVPDKAVPDKAVPDKAVPDKAVPDKRVERRPAAEQKLIDRTRRLLVEGHTHTAIEDITAARKIAPHDKLLDTLDKMAHGKTGKGELILDGKGDLLVDGKEFKAPKKLKLPAGPHVIGEGDAAQEIELGKGEKRHVGE
jgi:hypothetical protein